MGFRNEYKRLLTALKEGGHRTTAPRRAMLRYIAQTSEPVSVPEMHAAVNASLPPKSAEELFPDEEPEAEENAKGKADEINLVTVYRFANLLVEMGLLRRIEFGEGYARYERAESQDGPHHHHMVCRQCGKIEDFHGCDLHGLIGRLEAQSGYKISQHQLELYGACPDCLASGAVVR